MFATLRAHGVEETALGRVRSPVGLAIGAQSPQEIAVSIAAELILGQHPGPRPPRPRNRYGPDGGGCRNARSLSSG